MRVSKYIITQIRPLPPEAVTVCYQRQVGKVALSLSTAQRSNDDANNATEKQSRRVSVAIKAIDLSASGSILLAISESGRGASSPKRAKRSPTAAERTSSACDLVVVFVIGSSSYSQTSCVGDASTGY